MNAAASTSSGARALAFGTAIAIGACLLFQIQFVLGKLILPWFGGSASVWSTALVAFQGLLLAGYAYAHAIASLPTRRQQTTRHTVLLVVVLAVLAWRAAAWPSPVTPGDTWKPDPDGSPVAQILLLLVGAIGLPFVLLASTSPLLQRWYADSIEQDEGGRAKEEGGRVATTRERRRSPYRLYALSNLGSLVGLLSYPFLIEPRLDVFQQGRWWTAGYFLFAIATGACAWTMRSVPIAGPDRRLPAANDTEDDASAPAAAPSAGDYLLWTALAAVPAGLLQSTTTKITQDIAAVPFLWMVPLAIYLLTFVVAFEYPRAYHRHVMTTLVAVGLAVAHVEWSSTWVLLAVTLAVQAVASYALHGELARNAPPPRWLTRYFLVVAGGGVIGSALVAFGAPMIFDGLVEHPLTLMLVVLVLAAVYGTDARGTGAGGMIPRLTAIGLLLIGGLVAGKVALEWSRLTVDAVFTSRSFFGAIRVREQRFDTGEEYRRLQHGTTLHGMQYLDEPKRRQPTSYYTASSGVGMAMASLSALGRPVRVGVVGLGTGTMAAYGREGDEFTFFEIDPQMVALSTAPTPIFSYLRETAAHVTIVGGDARLSLERSRPSGFDVLVLDAFSSDAVPVHLLTQEAFALYARHLRDARSLLAVHVSNRYLDLEGVVQAAGEASGFTAVQVEDDLVDNDTERTTWMLLARDPSAVQMFGEPYAANGTAPWTDSSSNLLGVLRRE